MDFRQTVKSSIVYSSNPKSVAIGDLNNDQRMDIVVVNSGTDTFSIFLGIGNETFQNQQTYLTGFTSQPNSIVINHFNNDQYLDIAVANYGTNNIGIFFGNKNGTFENQTLISTNSFRPWFISCDDFNNDNYVDLAIAFYRTDNIGIVLSRNDGSFENLITYSTGYDSSPYALALKDLNKDGFVDIVVANYGTSNIGIFFNEGNGQFQKQILYSTTHDSHPSSVGIGDLNNDQHADIVVANSNHENIGIFFNEGNGTFTQQITHHIATKESFPQYVNIGDFDQDTNADVVILDSINNQIHILPGYGNGSFSNLATYDSISGSKPLFALIHENQSALVVVNSGTSNIMVLNGYFSDPSVRESMYLIGRNSRPSSVVVYDFNDDGELDMVVNNFNENHIVIFYGIGDGSFVRGNSYSTGENSSPQYICIGDLNHDQRMDIVVANSNGGGISIFLGKENGTFAPMIAYSNGIGSSPWFAAIEDFNNDTHLDIACTNRGPGTISIWFGVGDGSFTNLTVYSSTRYFLGNGIAVGDVNNDNHLDLIVVMEILAKPGVFLGSSNGNFTLITPSSAETEMTGFTIVVTDFNRDDNLDCAIVYSTSGVVGIHLGNGNGTFQSHYITVAQNLGELYYVVAIDFNNDNYLDLAVTSFTTSAIAILFGDGNGNFELGRLYSVDYASNLYALAIADLDHDNQLELIPTYWGTGYVSILTQYNAAKFSNENTYSTGSAPNTYSLAVGDLNNDNQTDVILANSGTDNLSIRFGSHNATFLSDIIYPLQSNSYPQYVLTGDVNKDEYFDLIVVNSKSNTMNLILGYGNGSFADSMSYTTGDNSRPYFVTMTDLNNDNRSDLIVANEGTNEIGIFFAFDYTTFILGNSYLFENCTRPSSVVVNDFNNDGELDIAVIFQTSRHLVILLGQGNGNFIISMSYFMGEGSNPTIITASDVDNDNQTDIIIAHAGWNYIDVFFGEGNGTFDPMNTYLIRLNFFATRIAVGDVNNDDIIDIVSVSSSGNSINILIGDGDGGFILTNSYSTGFSSRPEAVSLGDLNNDSHIDIVVANFGTDNVGIFLGYGNGSFTSQITYTTCYQCWPSWVTLADFNMDNISDIAATTYNGEYVIIYLGYGNGSFADGVPYSTGSGSSPTYLTVADFNNDNMLDIIVANNAIDSIVVLFGLGNGFFLLGTACSTGKGSAPQALAFGDFNGDKQLDVVVVNAQSNNIQIILGHDRELFAGMKKYTTGDGSQTRSIAVADFNNDGWSDVVVANYGTDNIGIFLGSTYGNLNSMITYSTGTNSGPHSVATSDLNNDNHNDIAVANSKSNTIDIFLGFGNGTFVLTSFYSTGDRAVPSTVAVSDFNNDHKFDIIIANSGANNILILYGNGDGTFGNERSYPLGYQYLPSSLAVNDLNKDGWMDIIIACLHTNSIETLVKMC